MTWTQTSLEMHKYDFVFYDQVISIYDLLQIMPKVFIKDILFSWHVYLLKEPIISLLHSQKIPSENSNTIYSLTSKTLLWCGSVSSSAHWLQWFKRVKDPEAVKMFWSIIDTIETTFQETYFSESVQLFSRV